MEATERPAEFPSSLELALARWGEASGVRLTVLFEARLPADEA